MGRSPGFVYGRTTGQKVIGKFDLNNEDEKILFITKVEGSFINKWNSWFRILSKCRGCDLQKRYSFHLGDIIKKSARTGWYHVFAPLFSYTFVLK